MKRIVSFLILLALFIVIQRIVVTASERRKEAKAKP